MTLRLLRSLSEGEEITVKYGPEYFGDSNRDCLCPHGEFHGRGVLVLSTRMRSQARFTGEKGKVKEITRPKRHARKVCVAARITNSNKNPHTVAPSIRRSREIVGLFSNHQGKK